VGRVSENLRLFTEVDESLTLLIALIFLYSLIIRQSKNSRSAARSLIQGLLFGCIAILGMQLPILDVGARTGTNVPARNTGSERKGGDPLRPGQVQSKPA